MSSDRNHANLLRQATAAAVVRFPYFIGRGLIVTFGVIAMIVVVASMITGCGGPKRVVESTSGGDALSEPLNVGTPVIVRVGLAVAAPAHEWVVTGPTDVYEGEQRSRRVRLPAGAVVRVERSATGVVWTSAAATGAADAVILQPVDPAHRLQSGESLDAEWIVRGEMLLRPDLRSGGLTVINVLGLEDYLRGVVPWEIGRHGEDALAATAAQAVAARTYTVAHLGARAGYGFDVWASVMDQVYRGCTGEDDLCNQAIARTAGQILTHDGRPIQAYYSSTCGGVTSWVEDVWPHEPRPYLQSRFDAPDTGQDAFCTASRYFRWREVWTAAQLEAVLARTLAEYIAYATRSDRAAWAGTPFSPFATGGDPTRPGSLRSLEIKSRTRSGRIARLDVVTTAGIYHVRGDRVRWVLAPASGKPTILRSARFDLTVTTNDGRPQRIEARGGGFGHGVGLCQVGALEMARRGHTTQQILAHYYTDARLVDLDGGR